MKFSYFLNFQTNTSTILDESWRCWTPLGDSKMEKWELFTNCKNYFSHTFNRGNLEACSHTINANLDLPMPSTIIESRPFIDLCNVFWRSVPKFARNPSPCNAKVQKDRQCSSSELSQWELDSLLALQETLTSTPGLAPRMHGPHTVETFPCDHKVGAYYFRRHQMDTMNPICTSHDL